MPRALLAAVAALALAPAPAVARQDDLWATVNVCDTGRHPDVIGIRASMPSTPRGARLTMRFRVQYRTGSGDWRDVPGTDSGWRVARGNPAEAGWSFTFAHPRNSVLLRGAVRFRWRKGDALPRQAEEFTEGGHRSSAGADPSGYSAATCTLGS